MKFMTPEEVIKGLNNIDRKMGRPHVHGLGPLPEHSVTLNSSHTLPIDLLHTYPNRNFPAGSSSNNKRIKAVKGCLEMYSL